MMSKVQEFKEQWEVDGKVIVPEAELFERQSEYDLDSTIEENGGHCHLKITMNDSLRFNKLFSLLKISELPQVAKDARDAQYVVNGLFGREDLSSEVRILLYTKSSQVKKLMDKIIQMRSNNNSGFAVK